LCDAVWQEKKLLMRGGPGMNLKEIKDLIEFISDKGFAEFEIKRQGFRLRVRRFQESPPQEIQSANAPASISPQLSTAPDSQPARAKATQNELVAGPPEGARAVGRESHVASEPGLHVINSPIVGTFFRSPSPTSDPFVTIGAQVEPDTVVCIIEAMKLMNEIQAEISGEIAKIYVENGQPVEYGQPLFGVRT
jgi:acetyl-CoA carboxylase biotin carboxyl carrier protein